jgi:hypothetical protein
MRQRVRNVKQPLRTLLYAVACLWLALAGGAGAFVALAAAESTSKGALPNGDWELIRDDDGIRTYRIQRPDSPLLAFKGEGVIDAPIDLVSSVCLDAERAGEWIGLLSESVVLRWLEEGRGYVQFTRFDLPWPVRDRVFVSRVVLDVDPDSYAATLSYHESDETPAIDDAILGSTAGTHFRMRPIEGGAKTFFTGIGIADPKGAIPVWLVNWAGRSVPHETLQALRRQVRKDDVSVSPLVESLYEGFEPGGDL